MATTTITATLADCSLWLIGGSYMQMLCWRKSIRSIRVYLQIYICIITVFLPNWCNPVEVASMTMFFPEWGVSGLTNVPTDVRQEKLAAINYIRFKPVWQTWFQKNIMFSFSISLLLVKSIVKSFRIKHDNRMRFSSKYEQQTSLNFSLGIVFRKFLSESSVSFLANGYQ